MLLKARNGCFYVPLNHNNKRLTAITAMPPTTPAMATWCFPYFSAVGRSSSRKMYIMTVDLLEVVFFSLGDDTMHGISDGTVAWYTKILEY